FDEHDESGREEDSLCSTSRHRSVVEKEGHADAHTHQAPRPAAGRTLRYRGGGDPSPPPSSTTAPPDSNSSSGNDNIIIIHRNVRSGSSTAAGAAADTATSPSVTGAEG
ncbi:unnamed protein product, partial [Ectocarpus sp. 8 AP-2014]